MSVVYAILLIAIMSLMIAARKKVCIPLSANEWYLKPFCKVILLIRSGNRKNGSLGFFQGIPLLGREEKNCLRYLSRLSPGKDMRIEAGRVIVKRLGYGLLIVTVGLLIAFFSSLSAYRDTYLQDGNVLQRGGYGDGEVERTMIADTEDYSETVDVTVSERTFSEAEISEFVSAAENELDNLILGNNSGLDHITENLELVNQIEGTPFSVSWESDHYDLVDPFGAVQNENLTEMTPVQLTADLCYEDTHVFLVRDVIICPKEYTDLQLWVKELQSAIDENQEKTKTEEYLELPTYVSGRMINWEEKKQDNSFALFGLFFLGALGCLFAGNRDLKKKISRRDRILILEYPELVSKLTLYLGAGMSVRNVFKQIGAGYRDRKGKKENPLYEEILITCNELSGGISETEAYEHFGKRCGLRPYIRFSALLNQNMKKGSVDLIRMLKKESQEAFDQRKAIARKAGEEAGTKLLFPMLMMLCVVMVIIMIPAYLSFSV